MFSLSPYLYHPHTSPRFALTVDVFILSDQVRVSRMFTVRPAIMGFELPEQGSGAQCRVRCVRTGEAPGPRCGLWCEVWVRARSDRSSLREDSAHGASMSHSHQWISQPNIRRSLLCISLTLICETFILAYSNNMQIWHTHTKKRKKSVANNVPFITVYSFYTQVIVAVGRWH